MSASDKPPKNIGQLIDQIEEIREALLSIQRDMEKMEPAKIPLVDKGEHR